LIDERLLNAVLVDAHRRPRTHSKTALALACLEAQRRTIDRSARQMSLIVAPPKRSVATASQSPPKVALPSCPASSGAGALDVALSWSMPSNCNQRGRRTPRKSPSGRVKRLSDRSGFYNAARGLESPCRPRPLPPSSPRNVVVVAAFSRIEFDDRLDHRSSYARHQVIEGTGVRLRCWSKGESLMTQRHPGLLLIYWIARTLGEFAAKNLFLMLSR
jgi:hypothetical protein